MNSKKSGRKTVAAEEGVGYVAPDMSKEQSQATMRIDITPAMLEQLQ